MKKLMFELSVFKLAQIWMFFFLLVICELKYISQPQSNFLKCYWNSSALYRLIGSNFFKPVWTTQTRKRNYSSLLWLLIGEKIKGSIYIFICRLFTHWWIMVSSEPAQSIFKLNAEYRWSFFYRHTNLPSTKNKILPSFIDFQGRFATFVLTIFMASLFFLSHLCKFCVGNCLDQI